MVKEIGSCQCILESIKTRTDGSFQISFSLNPDNQAIIQNLVKSFSNNEKLMQIALLVVE